MKKSLLFEQPDKKYLNFVPSVYNGSSTKLNIDTKLIEFKGETWAYAISEKISKEDKVFMKLNVRGNLDKIYFILNSWDER